MKAPQSLLAFAVIILAAALLITSNSDPGAAIPQGDPNITANNWTVVEDSTGGTTWYIGSATSKLDFDTSQVFDIYKWDVLSFSCKFRTNKLVDIDSADVGIIWQVSNDEVWWYPLDSLNTTDSLANFKSIDMSAAKWRYGRFVVHHGAVTADSGSAGTIEALRWGRQ